MTFGMEKLGWCGYWLPRRERKLLKMCLLCLFVWTESMNVTDGRTARHRMTAYAALMGGAVVQLVEYRTSNREVAGSTHTRSTASILEQVAYLLCTRANSASYPQLDGNE